MTNQNSNVNNATQPDISADADTAAASEATQTKKSMKPMLVLLAVLAGLCLLVALNMN